jgi:hypothetical protein
MVGMATFTLLALGITAGVIQSRRLSQLNVLRTSAYTVAQGYMEQIFSINPADLESASEPWVTSRPAIPTEAINSMTTNATLVEKSDPLYVSPITGNYPSGTNITARTGTSLTGDIWNNKQILIDLATNGTGGNATPIVMNERFDVQVSRAWTQVGGVWQIPNHRPSPAIFWSNSIFNFNPRVIPPWAG